MVASSHHLHLSDHEFQLLRELRRFRQKSIPLQRLTPARLVLREVFHHIGDCSKPDHLLSLRFACHVSHPPLICCRSPTIYHHYRLLTGVQLRNFCLNRTTSERFGKAKVVQESRTSTYLESQGGESFTDDDDLSSSILEAMQTRDH